VEAKYLFPPTFSNLPIHKIVTEHFIFICIFLSALSPSLLYIAFYMLHAHYVNSCNPQGELTLNKRIITVIMKAVLPGRGSAIALRWN
jgi:hypothetical protein